MSDDARPVSYRGQTARSAWPPDAVGQRHEGAALPVRPIPLRLARRIGYLAVGVGLLAQLLLVGQRPGVNGVLGTLALLCAGWLVRRNRLAFDRLDMWLPLAAVLFASFAAVRSDRALVTLDLLIAFALAGASIAAMAGIPVTRRPLSGLISVAAQGSAVAAAGATRLRPALHVGDGARDRLRGTGPVVRGLLLALPLILVFAALFASADAVFQRMTSDLLRFEVDLGDLLLRVAIASLAAWVAAGLLVLSAAPTRRLRVVSPIGWVRSTGRTEAMTMLLAVDLVFTVFVALQATYLFGGRDTLVDAGLTYSEYARRGFFELVVAVTLVGGLLYVLEATVRQRSRPYRGAALFLVGLSALVLASAAYRLSLYQAAYGWTELRFMVISVICWLAMCLVLAALTIASGRSRWLAHGTVVLGLVVTVAANVIGPQAFVAQQNIARVLDPSVVPADGHIGLDADYLIGLGDDAIPVLAEALPRLPEDERRVVADRLDRRLQRLRRIMPMLGWPSWNLARDEARAALERTLP
jgi:hypothetical protein